MPSRLRAGERYGDRARRLIDAREDPPWVARVARGGLSLSLPAGPMHGRPLVTRCSTCHSTPCRCGNNWRRDNQYVRVPLMFADAHAASTSTEMRVSGYADGEAGRRAADAAYEKERKRLEDAWKSPSPANDALQKLEPDDPWEAYRRRLEDAWKSKTAA